MKIQTKVVHSLSKQAWNVVSTTLGAKYKIAQCPYAVSNNDPDQVILNKLEALEYANFISDSLNNAFKTKGVKCP